MPNHHEKDLTAVLVRVPTAKSRLPVTLAEGSRTVKLTAPFRPRATERLWMKKRRLPGLSSFKPAMKKNRHRPVAVVGRDQPRLLDLAARHAV